VEKTKKERRIKISSRNNLNNKTLGFSDSLELQGTTINPSQRYKKTYIAKIQVKKNVRKSS